MLRVLQALWHSLRPRRGKTNGLTIASWHVAIAIRRRNV